MMNDGVCLQLRLQNKKKIHLINYHLKTAHLKVFYVWQDLSVTWPRLRSCSHFQLVQIEPIHTRILPISIQPID